MFTGIIRALGRVRSMRPNASGARLEIAAELRARRGDSIAVSGVCLTVAALRPGRLAFDAVRETLKLTTLGSLKPGDPVNLEPSLTLRDPLGGHFVMGHVDGTGRVVSKEPVGDGALLRVRASPEILGMLVKKGSVAVDGVSLTVTAATPTAFEIALVPHTLKVTTLGSCRPGSGVNLEVDMLARYVHAFSRGRRSSGLVTRELLRRAGFL